MKLVINILCLSELMMSLYDIKNDVAYWLRGVE